MMRDITREMDECRQNENMRCAVMMEMVENISLRKSIKSLKRAQRKTHLIFIYIIDYALIYMSVDDEIVCGLFHHCNS